jgi:amino acid adenylation domain-containing protein
MADFDRYIMESVLAGKIDKDVAVRVLTALKTGESPSGQGIAVIGMALRFPGADSPEQFWEIVSNRADVVRSLPERRRRDLDAYLSYLGVPAEERRYSTMGFLDQLDGFDYRFFRLTPKEASLMDPGQRLFLQTVWSAIEDAGYGGEQLVGSRTGVYVGYATYPAENYYRTLFDIDPVLLETGTVGNIPALLPARISYLLNLKGPAMVLDTACSSSLMAVHLACQALKKGECDMALAGGVRVSLFPAARNSIKLGVEAADNVTRAFDEHTSGAGSGEGVAAVLLKPLHKAISDGDHIYAVIRGGASNQDGTSISITAPNPAAQADVLLRAWQDAGINPEALSHIECHGSGTRLGDPIEIDALERAFSQHTERKQFCAVGTVKTCIGHLNESAGIAGLIKSILALQYKQLPPSGYFKRPNTRINFSDSPIYVNTVLRDWEPNGPKRLCGVSSFGLSGTNCHLVLEEAPEPPAFAASARSGPHLITFSAKTPAALQAMVAGYVEQVTGQIGVRLDDVCFTTNSGRGHYGCRLALVVEDWADFGEKLRTLREMEFAEARAPWLSYGYHRVITDDRSFREEGDISAAAKAELDRRAAERIAAFVTSGRTDAEALREICGLYVRGAQVNWADFYAGGQYRRVSLPTYPFEDIRCWVEFPAQAAVQPEAAEVELLEGAHYRMGWRQEAAQQLRALEKGAKVLLLTAGEETDHPLRAEVRAALQAQGLDVVEREAPGVHQLAQDAETGAATEREYQALFASLGAMQRLHILHVAALTGGNGIADAQSLHRSQIHGVYNLFHLVRGFLQQNVVKAADILLAAERVQEVTGQESGLNPQYGSLLGLGKGVGYEYPNLRVRCLDIDEATTAGHLLLEMAATDNMSPVAYRQGLRYVPELQEVAVTEPGPEISVQEGGLYLITGGFGGVGLTVGKHLAGRASIKLALVGRSGVPDRSEWGRILAESTDAKLCETLHMIQAIEETGSEVICCRADVANEAELRSLLDGLRAKYGRVAGIVHAAGVPGHSILIRKELREFVNCARPKVEGTWLLDQLTEEDAPDFFLMFSSAATLASEASMGDYVAANSFQDAYSAYRMRRRPGRTLTIDWVAWRDTGMAKDWGVNVDTIFKTIPTELALRSLDQALAMAGDRYVIGEINPAWYAQWIKLSEVIPYRLSEKITRVLNQAKAQLAGDAAASEITVTDESGRVSIVPLKTASRLRKADAGSVTLKGKAGTEFSEIERKVAAVYSEVLGYPEINIYDSFFELGGDSVLLARVYSLMDKEFPGVVRMTDLFEHTSVSKLAAYIQASTGAEEAAPNRPVKAKAAGPVGGDVAIIGLAFEMAGVNTLDGLRDVVFGGGDCVRNFPEGRRADMDRYIDFLRKANMGGAGVLEGMEYAPGGYLDDVSGFDHKLFRVSPKEASLMDPSQRTFLETVWRTIEDAGYGGRIEGTRTGVWVGYTHFSTYMSMVQNAEPGFLADSIPGNLSNMMSGRISYVLDLKGPGFVVDAACASSLVAVHLACTALRAGECDMAIAGGIRLHLLPQDHPSLKLGIEASDGLTRTFDNGAGGAGHGEGVAALLLKPLEQAERDGDHIYAVIKGSAVNQDGRSMSLTAPNPQAQFDVITDAWATAGIDPEALCYVEAHGTATPLGDPIEVGALQRAFATYTDRKQFCAIGSIKANMGHLYECAGMAGLIKSLLILQDRQLPPAVHFEQPNAKIDFADGALYVNAMPRPLETDGRPALAAVSSFGINGTNSHVVLEEYRPAALPAMDEPTGVQILPLSGKSQEALLSLVEAYRDFLRTHADVRLADIVGTAATGRGHYEHRLALMVRSVPELRMLVGQICETGIPTDDPAVCYAQHKIVSEGKENRAAWEMTAKEKAELNGQAAAAIDRRLEGTEAVAPELAQLYVRGADVNWDAALEAVAFRRISLPGYPFERTKCWVQIPELADVAESAPVDTAFWEMKWREMPLTVTAADARAPEGTVLLFRPPSAMAELAAGLAADLRRQGLQVTEVQAGAGEAECRRLLDDVGVTTIFYLVESGGDQFATLADLETRQSQGTVGLYCLARALSACERDLQLILVGQNVQRVTGQERELSPSATSAFGLSKVMRKEFLNLACKRIDLDAETPVADLVKEWKYGSASADAAYRRGARYEVEFSPIDLRGAAEQPLPVRENGVYLITGGAGGIGLEMARFLAATGPVKLALINRSRLPDRAEWEQVAARPEHKLHRKIAALREIEALGAEVRLYDASVTDRARMAEIAADLRTRYGRINGIIHAAGVSKDRLIGDRGPDGFDWGIFSPKVYGTWVLDEVTGQDALDFFLLFSSVATYFPTAGQAEYVAANAFLDGFAAWRNLRGKPTINLNWTTWKETGMAFEGGFTIDTMFKAQTTAAMMAKFTQALTRGVTNALVGDLNVEGGGLVILDRSQVKLAPELRRQVDAQKQRAGQGARPAAACSGGSKEVTLGGKSDDAYTVAERTLAEICREILGLEYIDVYDNFFELGAESIMLMRIQKRLDALYPGVVAVTDMFEYPSIHKLAEYITSQLPEAAAAAPAQVSTATAPATAQTETTPTPPAQAAPPTPEPPGDPIKDALKGLLADALKDLLKGGATEAVKAAAGLAPAVIEPAPAPVEVKDEPDTDIAIIGIGARLPGCDNLDEYWTKIRVGAEIAGKVPASRLPDIQRYLAAGKPFPDGTFELADGAYLEKIDEFDYGFFRLSPKEASLMDPNQRLALMAAWEAVEEAGYGGTRIAGSKTGVFFGFAPHVKDTYARYIMEFDPLSLVDADLGNVQSVLTGRISYLMDLKGPSMIVDTACSSSLTAVHLAVQAIRNGDCDMALAGGINLLTLPVNILDKPAGIGSADARTRTFDHLSEGTALGEGVATMLLKPLKAALRDGDHIHAVIKGTAVNQDGSSAGLSAPNPAAQQQVLLQAWDDAGIDPESIGYIEAHGTATPLGDPIEVRALNSAFSKRTSKKHFCALSSVKSNMGHLSHAAGMAGLLKAVLAMKHGELPPTINLQRPNEKVDFINSAVYINARAHKWEAGAQPRRCGISAFGISGTNAHVVLEEAPTVPAAPTQTTAGLHVLALSARTPSALKALVQAYADQVGDFTAEELAAVCYTANTGRGHYACRLTLTAADPADFQAKLRELATVDFTAAERPWLTYGVHRMVPGDRKQLEPGDLTNAAKVELGRRAGALIEQFRASDKRDGNVLEQLCRTYAAGADLNWEALYQGEAHRKISLPTYPFEGTRCWIDIPDAVEELPAAEINSPEGVFYSVIWRPEEGVPAPANSTGDRVLLLTTVASAGHPVAGQMAEVLRQKGCEVIEAEAPDVELAEQGLDASVQVEEAYRQLFEQVGSTERLQVLHLSTLPGGEGIASLESLDRSQALGALSLYHLVRGFSKQRIVKSADILVVSERVHEVTGRESSLNPQYASLFGLGKCVGQEYPGLRIRCVDIDEESTPEQLCAELGAAGDRMNPVAYRGGQRYAQQLVEATPDAAPEQAVTIREGGLYLITGGTGGIGLAVAQRLAEKERVRIALVSRSGLPDRADWERILAEGKDQRLCAKLRVLVGIEQRGSEVLTFRADVSQEAELRPIIETLRRRYGRIDGVLHSAGIPGASILIRKELKSFQAVSTPKVQGTWLVDQLTQVDEPDFFVMCSSIATLAGEASMGDYVAANTFQDAYAAYRSRTGRKTLTINWVVWRDTGMGVDFGVNIDGVFKALPTDVGVDAFEQALNSSLQRVIVGQLNAEMALQFATISELLPCGVSPMLSQYAAQGKRLLAVQSGQRPDVALIEDGKMAVLPAKTLAKMRKANTGAVTLKGKGGAEFSEIERKVAAIYSEVLGYQEINVYDSFFELGGDSIMLSRVFSLVDKEFPGVLRMSDLFEHTSVSKLAAYVQSSTGAPSVLPVKPARQQAATGSGDVAIIGLAFEMPGVNTLDGLRDIVFGGGEVIRNFPASRRADTDRYLRFVQKTSADAMILDGPFEYAAGGYLENIAGFDYKAFRLSPKEASLMDPSQRAFLEITWRAIEDAGYGGKIEGTRTGVWVGYSANHVYQRMVCYTEPESLTHALVGNMGNMMAGRIAFHLNLRGPAMVIDTACSSSLVAVHMACQAMKDGQCDMAIAGGLKLHLLPQDHPIMRIGNETSDGSTRSFDEDASGAGQGEGVAALLLKPLEQAERDGDHIYAVIKGTAVNHGGRAMSVTAPNPSAQVDVITEAWANAGIDPDALCYLEAHGTATRLGDPIEFDALQRVFSLYTTRKQFCAIGSIKANIGHLWEAAGMASLLKAILVLRDRQLPPAVHFDRPNAKIDFSDSAIFINTVPRPIETPDGRPALCAISGFGISGTNSHVVLEEYRPAPAPAAAETGAPQILPLSARSEEGLLRLVADYRDALRQYAGTVRLADVVGTAATGRWHYEHRLTLAVRTLDELETLLGRILEVGLTTADPAICYGQHKLVSDGKVARHPWEITAQQKAALTEQVPQVGDRLFANPDDPEAVAALCRFYVQGADVEWEQVLAEPEFRRVSLPGYPFERQKCWLEVPGVADVAQAAPEGPELTELQPEGLFYRIGWQPQALATAPVSGAGQRVLLLTSGAGEEHPMAAQAAAALRRHGFDVVEAPAPDGNLVSQGLDASAAVEAAYTQLFAGLGSTERLHVLHMSTLTGGSGISSAAGLDQSQAMGMLSLYHLVRGFSKQRQVKAAEILLVAERVFAVTGQESGLNPQHASLFGLGKCVGQEYPGLRVRCVDMDEGTAPEQILAEMTAVDDRLNPVAYRSGQRYAQQLGAAALDAAAAETVALREGGLYLLTGGTGGIALALARGLAAKQRVRLALVSRSGLPERSEWERILAEGTDPKLCAKLQVLREIEASGSEVLSFRANVAVEAEIRPVIESLRQQYGRIDGILHCAGVAGASILIRKDLERFLAVTTPKVQGTWLLDQLTQPDAPDFFMTCSSIASLAGEASMGDYVAANTFLDAYAAYRTRSGGRTLTINWVSWLSEGMAVEFGVNVDGIFKALPTDVAVEAFSQALASSAERLIIGELNPAMAGQFATVSDMLPCCLSPELSAYAATVKRSQAAQKADGSDVALIEDGKMTFVPQKTLARMRKAAAGGLTLKGKAGAEFSEIERKLAAVYSEVLGYHEINVYDSFFELGGDSIMLARVYTLVDKEFPGVLRMTDLFEYTSVSKLAAHIQGAAEQQQAQPVKLAAKARPAGPGSGDVAVIGLAFEMPGVNTLDGLRDLVFGGCEVIRDFPASRRKDTDRYLKFLNDTRRDGPGILDGEFQYAAGGYLDDIAGFDSKVFKMSPKEAALMDPSQRAFLEITWRAIEDAGYGGKIEGTRTGVWVGYATDNKYQRMVYDAEPAFLTNSMVGNMGNMMAGRTAYLHDLKGPVMVIDTACSSSLVGVHMACQALRAGECDMALAGAVKLHLLPQDHPILRIGNETSDGTTRSFDEGASGAGQGEGVAAFLLKPLEQAERDGDHIYAVIKGSAVNHGGRAMSLTAPNPAAQVEVITEAWSSAGIDPGDLCYLEAHGTATRLGDPIELDALQKAFARYTSRKQFCAIGSVKANVGHLWECAGMAGLLKSILIVQDRQLPPGVHFDRPNAKIDFSGSAVFVNTVTRPIQVEGPALCAVSGFGLSGTNSHVVVAEYRPVSVPAVVEEEGKTIQIVPLSARSEAALLHLVRTYRDFLHRQAGQVRLADIAGTAATGRWHYEHRLALPVRTVAELTERLEQLAESGFADPAVCYGQHKVVPEGKAGRTAWEITAQEKASLNQRALAAGDRFYFDPADAGAAAELCRLYAQGADIEWERVQAEADFRRVSLPGYPFERQKCWVEVPDTDDPSGNEEQAYYGMTWREGNLPAAAVAAQTKQGTVLLFRPDGGLEEFAGELAAELRQQGLQVVEAVTGCEGYMQVSERGYRLGDDEADYQRLLQAAEHSQPLASVFYLVDSSREQCASLTGLQASQQKGAYGLFCLARVLGPTERELEIIVAARNVQPVTGRESTVSPAAAAVFGFHRVLRKEHPNLLCRRVDLDLTSTAADLVREWQQGADTPDVAYRQGSRYVMEFGEVDLNRAPDQPWTVREEGVYLISGGAGGIGLEMARHLASLGRVKLALVNRTPLPDRGQWAEILAQPDHKLHRKVRTLHEIEAQGAEATLYAGDVADIGRMTEITSDLRRRYGRINGVIHAAGVARDAAIADREPNGFLWNVLTPKVHGTWVLDQVTRQDDLDFFVLFSSVASFFPTFGQGEYVAGNAFIDAFAAWRNLQGRRTVTINWTTWKETGMAFESGFTVDTIFKVLPTEAGVRRFARVLAKRVANVLIGDLNLEGNGLPLLQRSGVPIAAPLQAKLDQYQARSGKQVRASQPVRKADGPFAVVGRADGNYSALERTIARIWGEMLGFSEINIYDNYFELGGDSISGLKIANSISRELGRTVSMADLLMHNTVHDLARHVETTGGLVPGQPQSATDLPPVLPAGKREYYPVSPTQKGLYLLNEAEPVGTSYNVPTTHLVEGELDLERIQAALRQLVARHETLRTSFHIVDGGPVQVVHESVDLPLEVLEVEESADEAEMIVRAREVFARFLRPFDLRQAPLIRVGAARLSARRFLLLIDIHHIISDGITLEVLGTDFLKFYRGEEPAPLPVQYKDYAVWMEELFASEYMRRQEEFWLRTFASEAPVLQLPTDFARPLQQTFDGGHVTFALTREQTDALRKLARETGSTLYSVLLTVFNVLLWKYSRQEDIVVASPVAGRMLPELEQVAGMFINTVLMRNYPGGAKPFRQFLDEVRTNTFAALANQSYPYATLVEKVGVRRDPSRNPLFDVMFILQNYGLGESGFAEGLGVPINLDESLMNPAAKFDISIAAVEVADGITFDVEYRTQLFRAETMHRLGRHFAQIVDEVTANPQATLDQVDLMTAGEKADILDRFNATASAWEQHLPLHVLFERQAERTPDRTALVWQDQSLTYAELNSQANALADLLRSRGVGRESLVAVMLERSPAMIIAILGVLKAGGGYLPLDPSYPIDRLQYMLADSSTALVLTHSALAPKVPGVVTDQLWLDTLDLSAGGENLPNVTGPGDLAFVLYTSGTSGNPKGVMLEHRNVAAYVHAFTREMGSMADQTVLQLSSFSFDNFVEEVYPTLLGGGRLVIPTGKEFLDMERFASLVSTHKVTLISTSPLLLAEVNGVKGLESLRIVISGGDVLKPEYVSNLVKQARVYNTYGPTETTVCAAYHRFTGESPARSIPLGKPITGYRIYLLDQGGKLVPVGVPGELYIAGAGVTRGYLHREDLTAERFRPDPFVPGGRMYRTGDLARWLPDGSVEFLGRIDNQVKIRGFRVELGEIETVLLQFPGVHEAVVMAREDQPGNKRLVGYVVSANEAPLDLGALRSFVRATLPEYMVPSAFITLPHLPTTSNNKVDFRALPAPDGNQEGLRAAYVAPTTPTEEALASIWAELLGLEQVGINEDFFDLGGHSLLATRMVSRVRAALGVDLPLRALFEAPTVGELAVRVEEAMLVGLSDQELARMLEELDENEEG